MGGWVGGWVCGKCVQPKLLQQYCSLNAAPVPCSLLRKVLTKHVADIAVFVLAAAPVAAAAADITYDDRIKCGSCCDGCCW